MVAMCRNYICLPSESQAIYISIIEYETTRLIKKAKYSISISLSSANWTNGRNYGIVLSTHYIYAGF
ncbi:hypothetical protein ccbrp13_53080 [Ktedonobacteria bacterium brp13]|nr:hypothetical protein ccbrp13_53080 [Ktedonobacteria bacterium brp13]